MKRRNLVILGILTLLMMINVGSEIGIHEIGAQERDSHSLADYTPHGKILYTHEDNLTAWPGAGTPEEPYVISGLNITLNDTCISISNTDAFFVIRDCFLKYTGAINIPVIWLYNANTSLVEDCTIVGFRTCTIQQISHNSNITNNALNGQISVTSSSVYVAHNTILLDEFETHKAIRIITGSDFSVVFNNSINGQVVVGYCQGIEVHASDNVTVYNNHITSCKTNSIILTSSSFGNVTGNECTNGGSIVVETDWHHIEGNLVHGNNNGIVALGDNNTVIDNSILNNDGSGITFDGLDNRAYGNFIGFNQEDEQALEVNGANYWDDGVSIGNYWSDYDGEGTYTIPGNQGGVDHYPMLLMNSAISHPADIIFEFGDTTKGLSWESTGTIPESYELTRDGDLISSDSWDGSPLVFPLIGHDVGDYEFELTTFFGSGMAVSDSVGVIVQPSSGPEILVEQVSGVENETVEVTASITDLSGVQNAILAYSTDGSTWTNISMVETSSIWTATIPGDLADTEIEYRVYAWDSLGNWAVSEIKSYTVAANTTTTIPMEVFLIAGVGAVLVLLVAMVLVKRR